MHLQAIGLGCVRGERELFKRVDIDLHGGDALRVAGANGSGKTSLLRLLCGLACPTAGEVRWNGCAVGLRRAEFSSQLIYLGHANGVKDDLAAWENLAIAATLGGRPASRAQACAALAQLGLGRQAELPARALSQGQRKRVALARLLLGADQPCWILDEPFTALDAGAVAALCAVLDTHLAAGGMLVYTTHQEVRLGAGRPLQLELNPC